jgi:hypothetical protein
MTDDEAHAALLGDLLDRGFGAGPGGLPTPADRLAVGRRALRRRRRVTVAATSVAVVAAVGLGAALAGAAGGHGADGPPPPIATNRATAKPSATPSSPSNAADAAATKRRKAHRLDQRLVSAQFPASYTPDGRIVVKDGWAIAKRVDEPMGYLPPERSAGVVVTDGPHIRWMLLTLQREVDGQGKALDELGPMASADDPGKGYARFEDWLASMVELNGGARTAPLVTVDAADRIRPGSGAELVATRPAPVINGYTSDGDRMAEVRRDGRTWFVVLRGHGRDAEAIPVDAALLAAPTFAAFVKHVRKQVASGEGLR